eukprot:2899347-Amphidinium_carterae.1
MGFLEALCALLVGATGVSFVPVLSCRCVVLMATITPDENHAYVYIALFGQNEIIKIAVTRLVPALRDLNAS